MNRDRICYQRIRGKETNDSDSDGGHSEPDDFVDFLSQQSDNVTDVRFENKQRGQRKRFQQWIPEQFLLPKRHIPWKSIAYALGLFVMGIILLLCGCLIHIGKVDNQKYGDRLWPLIIFGLLMFIPGSYHTFIVVNVFLGKPGYSFEDFPQFEE